MNEADEIEGKRPRQDQDDEYQSSKKARVETLDGETHFATTMTSMPLTSVPTLPTIVSRTGLTPCLPELPPSLELVTGVKTDLTSRKGFVGQTEVGIIGYAGLPDFPGVKGIIKQRFTDFLVNEVSLSGEILHLNDIGKPAEPEVVEEVVDEIQSVAETRAALDEKQDTDIDTLPVELMFDSHPEWPQSVTTQLRNHFSDDTIIALHALLLDGKHPQPKQDSGWGTRKGQSETNEEEMALNLQGTSVSAGGDVGRKQGRDRGRGRGGSRGRGGRFGNDPWRAEDTREVVTQVIVEKEQRASAHQIIRQLFQGAFESNVRDSPGEGQRLVIKWASGRPNRQQKKPNRQFLPPYIHFTLHKTNRETQDCLGHIGRMLNVHSKDLTVCGTKDKRAVTVQRVCLRRGGMTLQSVWRSVNGIKAGRRTDQTAVDERGERGTRIGDLEYSKQLLDLGMLNGNHFTITLRNVQTGNGDDIDNIMTSIRDRGFLNFFGMQRFGTSTVPTHVTGLLLLQQKWGKAIDSILSLREGEHPDCVRARLAWLEDQDYEKALELMPRRSVAERSIWEHWKKGNRIEDKVGALGSIPRNLRSMYVHAYQSYIWNLVTSERIKLSNTSAIVGDLVFVDGLNDDDGDRGIKQNETSSSREVKCLSDEDVGNYTLFDVVMPLPGWNVEYPGGEIGRLYENILKADSLNPLRMRRDQREYSLPGSYRKIIQKPTNVSWEYFRYTDPDLPLVQADEDRILGLNVPVQDDPEGKFRALKISLSLGSSSYATMALREITREETSAWHQIGLTMTGEDQAYKGSVTETVIA